MTPTWKVQIPTPSAKRLTERTLEISGGNGWGNHDGFTIPVPKGVTEVRFKYDFGGEPSGEPKFWTTCDTSLMSNRRINRELAASGLK